MTILVGREVSYVRQFAGAVMCCDLDADNIV